MTWVKRRWFVSSRLTKQGEFVSPRCFQPPPPHFSRCVSSVLGLQSKSGGQFCHGRLLRDGDGFKRRSHQNVEAPFKRGTPDYLNRVWCQPVS